MTKLHALGCLWTAVASCSKAIEAAAGGGLQAWIPSLCVVVNQSNGVVTVKLSVGNQ